MPSISAAYKPPLLLRNAHANTIVSSLGRSVESAPYERKRLELSDGDFLDLDFSVQGSNTVVLALHGLEGSSDRPYMLGMLNQARQMGWDGVAMNHRGCSGEDNRLLQSYHSGKSDDLAEVIEYLGTMDYTSILVVGFSLGGNIVLKYMGENGASVPEKVHGAAAVSVPCHLESSQYKLCKGFNRVYTGRFLKTLKVKARAKKQLFPEAPFSLEELEAAKTLGEFDEFFTSRANGFVDAVDYWTKCSSKQFLGGIEIPTLLINAKDDPFLTEKCFPIEEAKANSNFHLAMPAYGGHVGFAPNMRLKGVFCTENMVCDFFADQCQP